MTALSQRGADPAHRLLAPTRPHAARKDLAVYSASSTGRCNTGLLK